MSNYADDFFIFLEGSAEQTLSSDPIEAANQIADYKIAERDNLIREENTQKYNVLTRGVASGIDSVQSMFGGATALLGQATGIDSLRDWGLEFYKEQEHEASLYEKPEFKKDPLGWVGFTAGNLLPSMAEAMGGAIIGSFAAPGAGTVAGGLLGKTILKKGIKELTETIIKRNAAQNITKAQAQKIATGQLLKAFSSKAGMVGATWQMETGGNYGEAVDEYGVDKASVSAALGTGLTSAMLELAGGNIRVIDDILGTKTGKLFTDAVKKGDSYMVARIAKEAAIQAPQEAMQEMGQEFLSLVNLKINDPAYEILTPENIARMGESAGAGAVGGAGFGGVSGAFKKPQELTRKPQIDKSKPSNLGAVAETVEPGPVEPEVKPRDDSGQLGDEIPNAGYDPVRAGLNEGQLGEVITSEQTDEEKTIALLEKRIKNLTKTPEKNRTKKQKENLVKYEAELSTLQEEQQSDLPEVPESRTEDRQEMQEVRLQGKNEQEIASSVLETPVSELTDLSDSIGYVGYAVESLKSDWGITDINLIREIRTAQKNGEDVTVAELKQRADARKQQNNQDSTSQGIGTKTSNEPKETNKSGRKSTLYDVDTEDLGTINGVNVIRDHDGSVAIFTEENTVEYNSDFASGKTDKELLEYLFEPSGFRGAKEQSGEGGDRQSQMEADNPALAEGEAARQDDTQAQDAQATTEGTEAPQSAAVANLTNKRRNAKAVTVTDPTAKLDGYVFVHPGTAKGKWQTVDSDGNVKSTGQFIVDRLEKLEREGKTARYAPTIQSTGETVQDVVRYDTTVEPVPETSTTKERTPAQKANDEKLRKARNVIDTEKDEKKANNKLPIINVYQDGDKKMTKAEWRDYGKDYKSVVVGDGYRYRSVLTSENGGTVSKPVFLTDSRVVELPKKAKEADQYQKEKQEHNDRADETKRLISVGKKAVPFIRLSYAEEVGRVYELKERGELTEEEWSNYVEELLSSGKISREEAQKEPASEPAKSEKNPFKVGDKVRFKNRSTVLEVTKISRNGVWVTGPNTVSGGKLEPHRVDMDEVEFAEDKKSSDSTSNKETKIDDFGEVLTGARKHYTDKLSDAEKLDTATVPLSKAWPEPDYQDLIEKGVDPYLVAIVRAMREEVPAKGRTGWKVKRYVDSVEMLRGFAKDILSGEISKKALTEKLNQKEFRNLKEKLHSVADLYQAVGHKNSLKGIKISVGSYGMYNGQKYSPPKTIWTISKKAKATAWSNWPTELAIGDTREEAIANFKAKADEILAKEKAKKRKTNFVVYTKSAKGDNKVYIGKKFSSRRYVDLESFDSLKEARAYLAEKQESLEQKLERIKKIPNERKETNAPRVGEDHLGGQDVTPEMFSEAFGFRGVQFGNYVDQKKRQSDLNEAYDALMDMAGVLGIPAKAISLNGELGLAFGARGRGGKGAPKAHYEGDTIVINLTKRDGAGSLAHEWWHALDNYFGRMRGEAGFLTENPREKKRYENGQVVPDPTRKEMIEAFEKVMNTINESSLPSRSSVLDQARSKPYWDTDVELSARAFEGYIIEKLADNNGANDYLANIVSQEAWDAAAAMGLEQENSYPYPTKEEIPTIKEAYQHFFDTVETKKTSQGVAMFSLTEKPQRSTWRKDFPDAIILAPLSAEKNNPDYEAGKAGDIDAALRFVESIITKDGLGKIADIANGADLVVSVHAEEAQGLNKIPSVFASVIAEQLGIDVELNIIQTDRPLRSAGDGFHRLANQPRFSGTIKEGAKHLILDDTITQGGTIASLKGYIESNGGEVIGAAALTGKQYSAKLALQEQTLISLREKHGELEGWWKEQFGYGFDKLTESEARYLTRVADADTIRTRISTARQKANYSLRQSQTSFQENQNLKQDVARPKKRADELQKLFGPITKKWQGGPAVLVVETEADLPNYLQNDIRRSKSQGRVRGLFDPKSNSVFIVAENVQTDEDAQRALLHESIGHYGLRGLLGKKLDPVLRMVAKSDTQRMSEIAENYGFDLENQEQKLKAAEELLAEMAEENRKPGFISRVGELIKSWLNTHGFSIKYSKDEMRALIARAKRKVEKGPSRGPGGGLSLSTEQPIFYSQMNRVLADKLPNRGAPKILKQQIENMAKKGQFKQEELSWSGLLEWLDTQSGKVSKDEITAFLNSGGVQVEEVVKGQPEQIPEKEAYHNAVKEYAEQNGYYFDDRGQEGYGYLFGDDTLEDMVAEGFPQDIVEQLDIEYDVENDSAEATKYSEYTLPGGSNYREVLLTLPQAGTVTKEHDWTGRAEVFHHGQFYARYLTREQAQRSVDAFINNQDNSERDRTGWEVKRLEGENAKAVEEKPAFQSSHWDEPNVLAHIRLIDRYLPRGIDPSVGVKKPNSLRKTLNDLASGEPSLESLLGKVDPLMITATEHDQIRKAVISFIPVEVMDDLISLNLAPDDLFSGKPVPSDYATVGSRIDIFAGIIFALEKTRATMRTKIINHNLAGRDGEIFPTLRTSDIDGSIVRMVLSPKLMNSRELIADSIASISAKLGTKSSLLSNIGPSKKLSTTELAKTLDFHDRLLLGRGNSIKEKTLFVEEVQSDWNLEGRKKGFRGTLPDGYEVRESKDQPGKFAVFDSTGGQRSGAYDTKELAVKDVTDRNAPQAPFVQNNNWQNLALKRVIRIAAEEGYDRVAWVTGEQTAERYSLDKKLNKIEYEKVSEDKYLLEIEDSNHMQILTERLEKPISANEISEMVGKEIAERITKGEGKPATEYRAVGGARTIPNAYVLEGDDLKIEAAWARNLYDKAVPNWMNKFGKKYGVKSEAIDIVQKPEVKGRPVPGQPGLTYEGFKAETSKQLSIPITDQMRSEVMQGQPLFSLLDKADKKLSALEDKVHNVPKEYSDVFGYNTFLGSVRKALRGVSMTDVDWRTALLDRYYPIKQKLGEDSYRAHRLLNNQGNILVTWLERGGIKREGGTTIVKGEDGAGFLPWFENLGEDGRKLLAWIAVKRAETLEAEGRENWLTPDKREKLLKWIGNGRDWKDLNKQFQAYNKEVLDLAEESGLINKESREVWETDIYIPFYREDGLFEDDILHPQKSKRHVSAQIKALKGGEMKINDLLENSLRNWGHLIQESQRNIARTRAVEAGRKLGTIGEVTGQELYLSSKAARKEHFIISFAEGGERTFVKVHDPALFNAMTEINLDYFGGPLMKALGFAKRTLTYGATFGPAFRVANAFRDTLHTAVISESFAPFIDTWRGAVQVMQRSDDYIALMGSGGGFGQGYLDSNDPKAMSRQIKKIVKREGEGAIGRIIDSPRKLLAAWDHLGHASEMAARTQLYTNLRKAGKSHEKAAYEARDILDFGLSGDAQIVRAAIATIPFLNARFQGLDRMARGAKANKKAFAVKGAMVAMASLALWALFKDDERYKELEDWEKWSYHHFWIGDYHYRLPKAFEVGAIFSSLPEALGDIANGNEDAGYFADFLAHTAISTFSLNMPAAITPAFEIATNKSTFTGRDIEDMGDKRMPTGLRADPWTSETLKVIGEKYNISPKKMQTLIRGHFGTLGMFLLGGADIITEQFSDVERPSWKIDQYPLVGRFIRSPEGRTKYATRMYDTFHEIDRLVQSINHYKEAEDIDMVRSIVNENRNLLALKKFKSRVQKSLKNLRKREYEIWKRDLPAEKKRQLLDDISKKKREIYKRAYEILEDKK